MLFTVFSSAFAVVYLSLFTFLYYCVTVSATPSHIVSLKSRMVFTFLVQVYPAYPGKEAVKRLFVCLSITVSIGE